MKLFPLLTPAGSDKHVQFNDSQLFGGDAAFVFDKSTGRVGIGTDTPVSAIELASGQLTLPDGSAAAPSLTFDGDPDSGIFQLTNNFINMSLQGTSRWKFSAQLLGAQEGTRAGILNEVPNSTNPNILVEHGDAGYGMGGDPDASPGYISLIANSVNVLNAVDSGFVGFGGESVPETLLELTHATPYITTHNSTHEDTDNGGESRWIGKREDGAGTETAAGQIEISHDGSGVNDQLGKIVLSTNTGSGLVDSLEVNSGGHVVQYNGTDKRYYDVGNSNYVGFKAPALTGNQIWTLPDSDGSANDIVKTDGSGNLDFVTPTVDIPIVFTMYDAEPARASVTNWNGGLLSLATAQPLDSIPTDIVVTKGIGKIIVVVNAGSDIAGDITITGESIDRDTGASTLADTDTITVDALTTDNTDTDSNGNTRSQFVGAYVSSKWFTGSVTLSTTNLTLTDVDVYHVSFEQFNDQATITLNTFDINILTTNVNAEFDAYLCDIQVTGDKCNLALNTELHVGADGETAIANKYWRLRAGNIGTSLDGTTDGVWVDIFYSNSPAYVEDVTAKVWATCSQSLTLT